PASPPSPYTTLFRSPLLESHAEVTHGHCDGLAVPCGGHHDVLAIAVLDRVDHQVAQDAVDPSGVELGRTRLRGKAQDHLDAALLRDLFGIADGLHDGVSDVGRFGAQDGSARVVTADLQQVD